jgi:F5/8 type C domain/Domain of unknown function (DUF4476)
MRLLAALVLFATAAAPPARAEVNLALGRPTATSSRSQWSRPDDGHGAVDGVKNGSFGFHTDALPDSWWQVDLGSVQPLDRVVIFNRQDCCAERARTLQVLLSDDGGSWRIVYKHDGSVFGGARDHRPLVVRLQGQPGRYLRLQLAERNNLHLDEVEVYGLDNLALGKPTSTSSRSQYSRPDDGHGAVDGVKNGSFGFHTDAQPGAWWQVDLGGLAVLDSVVIYNRQDCCAERARTLMVQLSNDGQAYRGVYDHDGSVFGGARDHRPLRVGLNGAEARYVRLQLRERNNLHLDEVEVYGHMIGERALPPPEAPPAVYRPPPPPQYQAPQQVGQAVSDDDYNAILAAVANEAFPTDKQRVMSEAVKGRWFNIDQLCRLIDQEGFGFDKVGAIRIFAPHVVDRNNAFKLQAKLTFESEKSEVGNIFR